MRASIERSPTQGDDDWGGPGKPLFAAVSGEIPCRAWSKSRVEHLDTGKTAIVEDMRAIIPHDADIRRNDRLTIKDRLGATLFDGAVAVLTKTRRGTTGSNPGHVELMLERHSA